MIVRIGLVVLLLSSLSCSSLKVTELDKKSLETNDEYTQMVEVKEIPFEEPKMVVKPMKPETKSEAKSVTQVESKKTPVKKVAEKKKKPDVKAKEGKTPKEMKKPESPQEVKLGRRPQVDPFNPGEKVSIALRYLSMDAGYLTFETLPYVEVNGEKAYKFRVTVKSSSLFDMFYTLNNSAETYVSFDKLIPFSHEVHINESKQIKESRSFFDWEKMKAHYWEKRITKEDGEQKRKLEWDLAEYSQNVISALFFLRTYDMQVGKEHTFPVADDGKIIMLTAKVVRKETIKTKAGKLNTVVIEPTMKVNGSFQQTGKIQLWLTDDEQKLLVKLKSKIKIGSINGELESIKR